MVILGMSEEEMKAALNEYLAFEIKSSINIRKTRELLMNIWYYPNTALDGVRELAIKSFQSESANKMAIHWCLMLLRYPIFEEVCSLIGKISQVQGDFSVSWLKEKLYEAWGERSTLLHSVDKILRTLRDMGAIENVKQGNYTVQKTAVTDDLSKCVLVRTILMLKEKAYYEPSELMSVPAFFPFSFEVNHQWIHEMGCFQVGSFAGRKVLVTD